MKSMLPFVLIFILGACGLADDNSLNVQTEKIDPLPLPVSNNAVTAVVTEDRQFVVSFAGLGKGREHADTLSVTMVTDSLRSRWHEATPLPGGVGRLAATAASVDGLAYVFGGYSVAADGTEVSTPWVHSFNPVTDVFTELAPMPVPVDDAVSVTFQDRYIFLISGWHDVGNVNLTQRYDTKTDTWAQATPIPGKALFGHAGGIVADTMVYCDGVTVKPFVDRSRDFVASDECFLGIFDEKDSRRIDWRRIEPHPGLPRYRMAAAGIPALNAVVFVGGSENPYNYDGIGYNGEPSEPASDGLLFDLSTHSWRVLSLSSPPTMDHRGLVPFGDFWLTVGGMMLRQQVTDQVVGYRLDSSGQ